MAWNKGLTKETDPRVAKQANSVASYVKTKEHCQHIGDARRGVPNPKHSEWLKIHWRGSNNPFYGKHHTEATKNRIAQANRGNTTRRGMKQPSTTGENNPAKRPDVRRKISEGLRRENCDRSNIDKALRRKDVREKHSMDICLAYKRGAYAHLSCGRMNNAESKLSYVLRSYYPGEWRYNGDGRVIIVAGKCMPDFVNVNGKKCVIELFGTHWHDKPDEFRRKRLLKKYGYDTLIIWERDLYYKREALLKRLRKFMGEREVMLL